MEAYAWMSCLCNLLLDVQMPGLDGFGVIKKLLDRKVTMPQIVFATAFDQYAVKAFEVNAVDDSSKPFDKKRVEQALEKARKKLESSASSSDQIGAGEMLEQQRPQASKVLSRRAKSDAAMIESAPKTSLVGRAPGDGRFGDPGAVEFAAFAAVAEPDRRELASTGVAGVCGCALGTVAV